MANPILPDITQDPVAFKALYNALLVVQKNNFDANGNNIGVQAETLAAMHPTAELCNLYDGILLKLQERLYNTPGSAWQNLDSSLVENDLIIHCNFDDDLEDETTNNLDLTLEGSSTEVYQSHMGVTGITMPGLSGVNLQRPSYDALLDIKGAWTHHALFLPYASSTGSDDYIVRFNAGSDSEADNYIYGIVVDSATNQLKWFQEKDAGVNIEHGFEVNLIPGVWQLITVTRDASGVVRLYINGILRGVVSAALDAPTGGSNARYGTLELFGLYGGLMTIDGQESAAAVKNMADHVRNGNPI